MLNLIDQIMQKQHSDTKLLNVRTQKWRQMLKYPFSKDINLVKKRIRKGVPPGMRQIVWPRLLDIEKFKYESQENYDLLIKQHSCIESEIRLDIPRTYTQQKAEQMRISLFNVLKALSLVYPELGYCQGMNHLSMKLLETVTDETGFWIMNYLIRVSRNLTWNYKNPSTTELQNNVLEQLMVKYTPNMMKTLKKYSIELLAFTPKWFITLFSSTLPSELFYRVFECFLIDGYQIIYKAALTMMKINQPYVLQNQYQQVLKHLLGKKQYENINQDEFCNTLHKFTFTNADIELLELNFINDYSSKVIKWQEQSQEYYQRRLEEERATKKSVPLVKKISNKFNMAKFDKVPFELYRFD